MDQSKYEERIKQESRCMYRLTNEDLRCKDCIHRLDDSTVFGNTSRCKAYPDGKPNNVLLGNDCEKYEKEK